MTADDEERRQLIIGKQFLAEAIGLAERIERRIESLKTQGSSAVLYLNGTQ